MAQKFLNFSWDIAPNKEQKTMSMQNFLFSFLWKVQASAS